VSTRGRRTGGGLDSRQAILEAARASFAKRGYRGTTLRAVATRARVDMALIGHFFGSKEQLFASAIDLPAIGAGLEELLAAPGQVSGETVVRFYLERIFPEHLPSISALLRTALGDSAHTPRLRALIREALVEGSARALGGPEAKLRAELFGAQMTGLFISRYLVRIEPLTSASVDAVAALLGPSVEVLLGRPLVSRRRRSAPTRSEEAES
jgi:AcrR family transcriptional regulator